MSVRRPVVIGWALLAVGGWAATLWLGEPSATAGPGPAPAAGVRDDNPEPGPQPESGRCETTRAPSPSAMPWPKAEVYDSTDIQTTIVDCLYVVSRDGATAR
ncbi:hypothetical protein ACIREO_11295 [Streptomyces sp. NPDC102441]|uniref:hypothetical protein n=1 Tax=Streptomyces sp. NPDC102441 TaxID=3366176 RepID=UPI0037F1DB6B